MTKRSTSNRELIDTQRNKMFAKRDVHGRFKEMDDVSRSLPADRRTAAKTVSKPGYGDVADRATKTNKGPIFAGTNRSLED